MERDVTITACSLHPVTGVEVSGLDLRKPITGSDAAELRALFDRHALLHFRAPSLDADSQRRLVEAIGPVPEAATYVSNVEPDGYRPEHALLWHHDFAFTPHPLFGISLYALEVGEGCVPTRFANTAHGAATLPASLRNRLEGLELVQLACLAESGREDVRQREADYGGPDLPLDIYPRTARPVLWEHPRTGVELLWVGEQQASHFVGVGYQESAELLEEVFAHLYRDEVVYDHHWSEGDLLVWDNITLGHGRREAPATVRRSLRRFVMSDLTQLEIISGLRVEHRPAAFARAQDLKSTR
jgi:taurine dioxygenase